MIKILNKLGTEKNLLTLNKSVCEKAPDNLIHSDERLNGFSLGKEQEKDICSHRCLLFHRHPDWKEELKQSLFTDDILLYIENPEGKN